MMTTNQTKGMSILEHGESVAEWFHDLHEFLMNGSCLTKSWKLPAWIGETTILKQNLLPLEICREYQVFHDCGKPFCIELDDEGKQHFPDHANVSAHVWRTIGGDPMVENLIRMDMDIHTLKAVDVDEFVKRQEAITLLLAGLCEVHSNAQMFGGIESTSFKIKWKQIDKRGSAIIKRLKMKEQ